MPDAAVDAAYAYCADLVRSQDRDRFLAALFAPEAARRHLFALYAFNVEVARVRDVIREALPGEVRLAWWREAIEGQGRGDVEGHPVAVAVMDTIARHHLPKDAFIALADARIFDLYDDPMPSFADLEGYAGETASALLRLAALLLAPEAAADTATAAGHGGVALALTGLMRSLPIHAARGQCFLPLDVLARHGLDREAAVSGQASPALAAVLRELNDAARAHLKAAAGAISAFPPDEGRTLTPAFLPLSLIDGDLKALARAKDPFRAVTGLSPLRRQLTLWWAARRAGAGKPWLRTG